MFITSDSELKGKKDSWRITTGQLTQLIKKYWKQIKAKDWHQPDNVDQLYEALVEYNHTLDTTLSVPKINKWLSGYQDLTAEGIEKIKKYGFYIGADLELAFETIFSE